MSNSHHLAHSQGGLTRTNLFIAVLASQETTHGFKYSLEGMTDENTWEQSSGSFDIPLHGVSCVSVAAWDEIDFDSEIGVLWKIRNDGSPEADRLRQELEDFMLAKMQGISLEHYSAYASPSDWVAEGDGIEPLASKIRASEDSIYDAVAAEIAEMKAEAIEDDVLFESEDWAALRKELLSAADAPSNDFVS